MFHVIAISLQITEFTHNSNQWLGKTAHLQKCNWLKYSPHHLATMTQCLFVAHYHNRNSYKSQWCISLNIHRSLYKALLQIHPCCHVFTFSLFHKLYLLCRFFIWMHVLCRQEWRKHDDKFASWWRALRNRSRYRINPSKTNFCLSIISAIYISSKNVSTVWLQMTWRQ